MSSQLTRLKPTPSDRSISRSLEDEMGRVDATRDFARNLLTILFLRPARARSTRDELSGGGYKMWQRSLTCWMNCSKGTWWNSSVEVRATGTLVELRASIGCSFSPLGGAFTGLNRCGLASLSVAASPMIKEISACNRVQKSSWRNVILVKPIMIYFLKSITLKRLRND